MTLFEECIMALGKDVKVLDQEKTNYYFNQLVSKFPIASWARINWDEIETKKKIDDLQEILQWLNNASISDLRVILLWNYSDAPAVSTDLKNALRVIDDVTAVGSDTFMFCPSAGYVIEFYHEGEITIGLASEG